MIFLSINFLLVFLSLVLLMSLSNNEIPESYRVVRSGTSMRLHDNDHDDRIIDYQ